MITQVLITGHLSEDFLRSHHEQALNDFVVYVRVSYDMKSILLNPDMGA